MDDYPYMSTFVSHDDMIQAWNKLQNFQGKSTMVTKYKLNNTNIDPKYKNGYQVIYTSYNDYFQINFLTDYFTEYSRIRAKRFDQELSSYDYWCKNKQDLKKFSKSQKELRSILYKSTIEVMNFRLTIAATIYDIFNPIKIFDPCCGHGDRAIAALSRPFISKYEGCEPNLESQSRIILALETLEKELEKKLENKQKDFCIYPIGFEDFTITSLYDLIFTSPPYFDVEVYCHSKTQSIVKYPNKKQWYNEFLLPMFLKCWMYLKVGGHMIISINNVRHKNYLVFDCTERLVSDISKYCQNAEYVGVLSYGDFGCRMEPMFIWKKIKNHML